MDKNTLSIIHSIFLLIAIYFSFKRNNGFDLGSFLIAIIVPEIYVVYVLATTPNINSLRPGYYDNGIMRY